MERDTCLFCGELRRSAGIPVCGIVQKAVLLVRSCAGWSIFQIGAVRFTVSQRYLLGIEEAQSFCKAAPLGGDSPSGYCQELDNRA